jgi:alkylation response protein AidB-like acyl-CoA dehydrogenase
MRLALTGEQEAVRDAVREALEKACPPAVVRAAWPGAGADPAAVDALAGVLARMGVPGMAAPPEHGGSGLDDVGVAAVLVELGAAAVPLPIAGTAAVAVPLLVAAGDPGGRLAGVVDGTTRVAVRDVPGPVLYAGRADRVLDLTGGRASLLPADGAPLSTVDGSLAARTIDGRDGEVVTEDPALVASARERMCVATAAQLIGLCRRMLDLTVTHVRARKQFGVPVGSFQAVQHRLADALVHVEFAEPAVHAAAWAVGTGAAQRRRDVSAAVVLAVEAARFVARAALQCHGAIGHTVEYDLHLYAKRAWALTATCDLDAHLERLAGALDLPDGPAGKGARV